MKLNNDKLKNIKESFMDKKKKALIFFGFYFVFFAIIFVVFSTSNYNQPDNTGGDHTDIEKGKWEILTDNYEFRYDINVRYDENVDFTITLEGKRFGDKQLFTKYIDNKFDNTIYVDDEVEMIQEDTQFIKIESYLLVFEDFNHSLLDSNYIKSIVKELNPLDIKVNFDESVTETYLYDNGLEIIEIEVISKNEVIKSISLAKKNVYIFLQYKNINEVKDFVI